MVIQQGECGQIFVRDILRATVLISEKHCLQLDDLECVSLPEFGCHPNVILGRLKVSESYYLQSF